MQIFWKINQVIVPFLKKEIKAETNRLMIVGKSAEKFTKIIKLFYFMNSNYEKIFLKFF